MTNSKLPYDPDQWARMASRLDAHYGVPQPSARRSIIPLLPWAGIAVAACLAVLAAVYLPRQETMPSTTVAREMSAPRSPSPATNEMPQQAFQPPAITALPARSVPSAARRTGSQQIAARRDEVRPAVDETLAAAGGTREEMATPTPEADYTSAPQAADRPRIANRLPATTLLTQPEREDDVETKKQRLAFGVNGGYNIGQAKNNFTVGVSVKRNLGNRLQLETGLALVSGSQETTHRMVPANAYDGQSIGASMEAREPIQVASRHMYLQAAPTLSYRIYKGLSAGGGVDAQRLLGTNVNGTAMGIASESGTQPQWDFGLTARMDVQVAKKLRAGMMYRESMRAVSKGAYAGSKRNYLLVQLSYTLFQ